VTTVAVVDYGMGNRRSVQKALEHVGARAQISSDPAGLAAADGIVLPGVGAFPLAMRNLTELGLDKPLRAAANQRKPLLGICLGMQLLFERSEELQPTAGLGLIEGEVTRVNSGALRLPHIGWNEVTFKRPSALTEALPPGGCAFYHVHSFAARCANDGDLVATTTYGETFATIVQRDRVFGVQFHPEKSSTDGLAMLDSFAALCRSHAASAVPVAARR
jgi:glutamine amidotransferase